jgi:PAS domain S-box-containing protein
LTISPDPTPKTSKDLHFIGDTLVRISRALHEQTRTLETAVEGTYASERGDPRVQLLSDALSVSRTADLELGRVTLAAKRVLLALQEQFSTGQQASVPTITPSAQPTASVIPEHEREALTTSITNLERKRSELETLYEIAQDLNSTLKFDDVLRLAMDKVIRVVGAERGFIVLVNPETGSIEFKIARDKQARAIVKGAFEISQSTLERVVKTRKPLLSDRSDDPTKSMMAYDIRSIMCAPLIVRGNCIGAVYVDSRQHASLFNEKALDLLLAFCNQAAIAIDNARLFSKVNEDKQYMDNIFASMANGVITTNSAGIITTFNLAASYILGLDPAQVVGKHYQEVSKALPQVRLAELLQNATLQHEHGTIVPHSIDCVIPGRGTVNLDLHVSSLRDQETGAPIGMALVIDDRTDIKRAKAEAKEIRDIFGRYVHPSVVNRLIADPQALNLGGETREITVLFADIRGSTRLGEITPPEQMMNLLNGYWEKMVEAIWNQGGTITAFLGDGLMAIFNAPLAQEDHALRAVRAALGMREGVLAYQRNIPPQLHVAFGFGINTGQAVVGNLGSGRMQNYTAIGDTVNVAERIQGKVSDNDILLNHTTFIQVRQHVRVEKLAPMYVKNKTEPLDVFRLIGLL